MLYIKIDTMMQRDEGQIKKLTTVQCKKVDPRMQRNSSAYLLRKKVNVKKTDSRMQRSDDKCCGKESM